MQKRKYENAFCTWAPAKQSNWAQYLITTLVLRPVYGRDFNFSSRWRKTREKENENSRANFLTFFGQSCCLTAICIKCQAKSDKVDTITQFAARTKVKPRIKALNFLQPGWSLGNCLATILRWQVWRNSQRLSISKYLKYLQLFKCWHSQQFCHCWLLAATPPAGTPPPAAGSNYLWKGSCLPIVWANQISHCSCPFRR